jgi:Family of unknown function (DUF6308)
LSTGRNNGRRFIPPITIADRSIVNPAGAVMQYLEQHGGTVAHYDLVAGTFEQVNLSLIRATRSPWMGSRISAGQAAWFIDRGSTAPWSVIPVGAELKQADPLVEGGLYDRGTALWEHFWDARPMHVSTAKISKVLYLMRPGIVSILDSNLIRFYRGAARAAAADVGQQRPSLNRFTALYWEAIRRDVIGAEAALRLLREALDQSLVPLAEIVSQKVSDLRLLDMLAWAAESGSRHVRL